MSLVEPTLTSFMFIPLFKQIITTLRKTQVHISLESLSPALIMV
jgi:hypothetical protein